MRRIRFTPNQEPFRVLLRTNETPGSSDRAENEQSQGFERRSKVVSLRGFSLTIKVLGLRFYATCESFHESFKSLLYSRVSRIFPSLIAKYAQKSKLIRIVFVERHKMRNLLRNMLSVFKPPNLNSINLNMRSPKRPLSFSQSRPSWQERQERWIHHSHQEFLRILSFYSLFVANNVSTHPDYIN